VLVTTRRFMENDEATIRLFGSFIEECN